MQSEPSRIPAWYAGEIPTFLATSPEAVLGHLAAASPFPVELAQRDAWQRAIALLREALAGVPGWLFLEFDVPRLGSRIDAVVVAGAALVPVEFKVGEREFRCADFDQAWDYGLDPLLTGRAGRRLPYRARRGSGILTGEST